jgi:hypothetical protein
MRFSRIVLENWRNFKRVDVPLQSRAFLVGPNASGKSNFLDAFRFLHDVAASGGGLGSLPGIEGAWHTCAIYLREGSRISWWKSLLPMERSPSGATGSPLATMTTGCRF